MSQFLGPDERHSSGVIKITRYLTEQLESLRVKNDTAMPEADRAPLLGEIAAVKKLLSFTEKAPVAIADESRFED